MADISVILPRVSTAFLPDAVLVDFGHSTDMDLPAILRRIDARQAELGLTDHAVAKAADRPDIVRNLRRAVKDGRQGATTGTINRIAKALRVTPTWLIGEESGDEPSPDAGSDIERLRAKRLALMRELEHVEYSILLLDQPRSRATPKVAAKKR